MQHLPITVNIIHQVNIIRTVLWFHQLKTGVFTQDKINASLYS